MGQQTYWKQHYAFLVTFSVIYIIYFMIFLLPSFYFVARIIDPLLDKINNILLSYLAVILIDLFLSTMAVFVAIRLYHKLGKKQAYWRIFIILTALLFFIVMLLMSPLADM